jgi:putative endonuclease
MQYFYVYILKCNDGSYYAGHTDNIEARISQHKQGLIKNCYTITRLPITVVFVQTFANRNEAFHAERKIKGWTRQKIVRHPSIRALRAHSGRAGY